MADLITAFQFELVEDHHAPGSGRYGVRVVLPDDISAVFPYLNAVLDDTQYDHANGILIGTNDRRRYAFRPHEIQLGIVTERSNAESIVKEVIALANRVWRERERIVPSLRPRKLPTALEIYRSLPKTNCKECGYATCLAFAAAMRSGAVSPEGCLPLSKPGYVGNLEQIRALFS